MRLRRSTPPPASASLPTPDDVYYEATTTATITGGTTDRAREVRSFTLMAGDSFSWPVLYGTPVTDGDVELLGPFTQAEWQERIAQREAEEARLAKEQRQARETAAREMAREILTEDAPIEARVERLAEVIIAAEYGGWDDLRERISP